MKWLFSNLTELINLLTTIQITVEGIELTLFVTTNIYVYWIDSVLYMQMYSIANYILQTTTIY